MSGSCRDQGQPDQRSSTVIDDKGCREQVGKYARGNFVFAVVDIPAQGI